MASQARVGTTRDRDCLADASKVKKRNWVAEVSGIGRVYVIDKDRDTVFRLHGSLKLATAHVTTEEQPRSFAASNSPTTKFVVFCAPSKPKGRIRSTFESL
jgi:hypothetical protein